MVAAATGHNGDLGFGVLGVDDLVLDVAGHGGVGQGNAEERAGDEVRRVVDEVFCWDRYLGASILLILGLGAYTTCWRFETGSLLFGARSEVEVTTIWGNGLGRSGHLQFIYERYRTIDREA